jgi:hypothetical protein
MSLGQIAPNSRFHPNFLAQNRNSVWSYGPGRYVSGTRPPPLQQPVGDAECERLRLRHQRDPAPLPQRPQRRGERQHLQRAHFSGTFYDFRWSTALARRDKIYTQATDRRASYPDGNGGPVNAAGDFRELQGTMWFHDHRFFFTARMSTRQWNDF